MLFITALFVTIANSQKLIPNNITADDIVSLPVTFYLDQLQSAPTDYRQALYYYVGLCKKGISDRKQAVLQIYEGANPEWNTTYHPYIVVQVSKCFNNFTQDCVIATNYQWGVNVKAVSNISWTLNNETDKYWIRVMGQYKPSEFSMELSFNDTANVFSYPWTSIHPFNTDHQVINSAQPLLQYWKAEGEYTVDNDVPITFEIGYCDQSENIKGIDVSLAAKTDSNDYSLVQQWVCPQTISINECTQSNAQNGGVGWSNQKIASFNLLPCIIIDGTITTADGIWVFVVGNGANQDSKNTFSFYATQH